MPDDQAVSDDTASSEHLETPWMRTIFSFFKQYHITDILTFLLSLMPLMKKSTDTPEAAGSTAYDKRIKLVHFEGISHEMDALTDRDRCQTTVEETLEYEKRTLMFDTLFYQLQGVCRREGLWLENIPTQCPPDRLIFATPEALVFWSILADANYIPSEEKAAPAGNVGLRIMASMWRDLLRLVFTPLANPPREGKLAPYAALDVETPAGAREAERVVSKLVRQYRIFERSPYLSQEHREHERQVQNLVDAALNFRSYLLMLNDPVKGDSRFTYGLYVPLRKAGSERRFTLLQNQNRQVAHFGDDCQEDDPDNERVVFMTVFGGLVRRGRQYDENKRRVIPSQRMTVWERKASVVTATRPRVEKSLKPDEGSLIRGWMNRQATGSM